MNPYQTRTLKELKAYHEEEYRYHNANLGREDAYMVFDIPKVRDIRNEHDRFAKLASELLAGLSEP